MVTVTVLLVPAAVPLPVTVKVYVPSTSVVSSIVSPFTVTVFRIRRPPRSRLFTNVAVGIVASSPAVTVTSAPVPSAFAGAALTNSIPFALSAAGILSVIV